MDRNEALLNEVRQANKQALQKAFQKMFTNFDRAFRSDTNVRSIPEQSSDFFYLSSETGQRAQYRLVLSEIPLRASAPSPHLELQDQNGMQVGEGDFYSKNATITQGQDTHHGVEYSSALYMKDESLMGVGIGSELSRSGEALLLRIWEHWSTFGEQDFLRLKIVDDSTPPKWTSRRAEEQGYSQAEDVDGKPSFEKVIWLRSESLGQKLTGLMKKLRH